MRAISIYCSVALIRVLAHFVRPAIAFCLRSAFESHCRLLFRRSDRCVFLSPEPLHRGRPPRSERSLQLNWFLNCILSPLKRTAERPAATIITAERIIASVSRLMHCIIAASHCYCAASSAASRGFQLLISRAKINLTGSSCSGSRCATKARTPLGSRCARFSRWKWSNFN